MKQKTHTPNKHKQPKWIALLVAVILLNTALPLQWAHSYTHTEETCEESDTCQDNNPCHITLRHQHASVEHCEHNGHYTEQHEGCEFCHLLSHHQQQYTQPTLYATGSLVTISLLTIDFSKNYTPVFSPSQTNKGPPVV